jgi:hypothetical protein
VIAYAVEIAIGYWGRRMELTCDKANKGSSIHKFCVMGGYYKGDYPCVDVKSPKGLARCMADMRINLRLKEKWESGVNVCGSKYRKEVKSGKAIGHTNMDHYCKLAIFIAGACQAAMTRAGSGKPWLQWGETRQDASLTSEYCWFVTELFGHVELMYNKQDTKRDERKLWDSVLIGNCIYESKTDANIAEYCKAAVPYWGMVPCYTSSFKKNYNDPQCVKSGKIAARMFKNFTWQGFAKICKEARAGKDAMKIGICDITYAYVKLCFANKLKQSATVKQFCAIKLEADKHWMKVLKKL